MKEPRVEFRSARQLYVQVSSDSISELSFVPSSGKAAFLEQYDFQEGVELLKKMPDNILLEELRFKQTLYEQDTLRRHKVEAVDAAIKFLQRVKEHLEETRMPF